MASIRSGFHLLIYSDAEVRGGAEVTLGHVLASMPDEVSVSILGVSAEVVEWLAERRPGVTTEVIAPIASRRDIAGMVAHRRAFARIGADVCQFNLATMSSCQWAMASALSIRGNTCIAVENSPMGTWSATSARLKRLTSARLAAHVAVGEATARAIEKTGGLRAGSVRTLYHGVPDVERHPAPRPNDGPLIGTIARHDRVKGVDVLLDAMVELPDVHAVLIGSGTETEALVAQRDRLDLADRVEFRDVPWGESAIDHLASFDVFVLPSRLEGFPVTIMEAMLAGVPVVATDVGSVRESVTDGESGLVVRPEDPAALAAAIRRLIDDPDLREAMGTEARRRGVERFTVAATVDSYLSLYDEILSAKASR